MASVVAWPLRPASFVNIHSRCPVRHRLSSGGAESAASYITWVAGYRRYRRGRWCPCIHSITQAPDQTAKEPRLLHSCFGLAALSHLHMLRTQTDFHELSPEHCTRSGASKVHMIACLTRTPPSYLHETPKAGYVCNVAETSLQEGGNDSVVKAQWATPPMFAPKPLRLCTC